LPVSRGGIYPYFICVGRQQKRTDCKQRAIRIEQAEAAIVAYYATVQLPEAEVERLRVYLGEELSKLRADSERDRNVQARRLRQLQAERKKLLDAHYADAIPLDLLKSEQDRLTTEIANAEGRLTEIEGDFNAAETNLQRALTRAGDCEATYREAEGNLRRQFNLAFFRRLLIGDDYTVTGELAEPFDVILGDDLRRAAVVQADRELQEAVEMALRRRAASSEPVQNDPHPREPERPLVGAGTPASSQGGGWNAINLVHLLGRFTNPSAPLKAVFEALPDEPIESSVRPEPLVATGRLGNGAVQRAVVKVLAAADGPMRGVDIHRAVERLLGQSVSRHSVSWCLLSGVRAKEPRFERVSYGCYRVARAA
jgi:hypothetical protein